MTRGALKIATIGGGSSYTPELIEGYIKRKMMNCQLRKFG